MQNDIDGEISISLALLPLMLAEGRRSKDGKIAAAVASSALSESLKGDNAPLLELVSNVDKGVGRRSSGYFITHSSERWLSFGVERSVKFLDALLSCDTPESWSWIERCSYDGPSSVTALGFSSPQGWSTLTSVADALQENPVSMGVESSLYEAASSLHYGVKYAAFFASRDPFPKYATHLFEPNDNLLTYSEDDAHLENCARRLLQHAPVPKEAKADWLGGISADVLSVLLPDVSKSFIISSLEINPDVLLADMVEALAAL
jgi:hypothetical protein